MGLLQGVCLTAAQVWESFLFRNYILKVFFSSSECLVLYQPRRSWSVGDHLDLKALPRAWFKSTKDFPANSGEIEGSIRLDPDIWLDFPRMFP